MSILDTGVRNVRNVLRYTVGEGALSELPKLLAARRSEGTYSIVFFIDAFFKSQPDIIARLGITSDDKTVFVATEEEPSTDAIDQITIQLRDIGFAQPCAIVGMGGGITMDVAKAVSNLLTNGGKAEDYQGWDLIKTPGIYKVAIPTLSGTGAEATRTCVMTNKRTSLKLGMNSDFTVYDQIVMDPMLTATVPRSQYFYTGMDAYIHCVEALAGNYRNAIGDAYSRETINLCRQVFLEGDMMSPLNRERLMVASYLGGCAIATSYVGLVHPFSAGLSVVLGLHHCVANCIVMRAMQPYYPKEFDEFWKMVEKQEVDIPEGIARNLSDYQYEQLYASTIIHQKPLTNALGEEYRNTLTKEKVTKIFKQM
ncbi:MAG: iron-containing alcohol dehydrogenase family protein [Thiothrix sp.]|uniref:iron-containing alcohol dehydrogenase family protein n=1 Tax=Thiothrix sp. TaxID=1032 RepID=UPI002614AE8C|nr:iron-containing alcohol dehydrogenase family protein [Thiothrix sp.]MDD5392909.1 iron-containing alcohol dehydrogenase family protein [Thiothrix sp.]